MEKWIIRSKKPRLSESGNNEPCASVSKSETTGASSTVCVNTAAIDNSVTQNGVKYFPNSF
jgi:hypothetical protein